MRKVSFVIIMLVTYLAFSCGKKIEETTVPDTPEQVGTDVTVKSNVKVVDSTVMKLTSTADMLSKGIYEFTGTDVPGYKANDVIVGQTGNGYLRTVLSAQKSGDKITLQTRQGTLAEVFKNGKISFQTDADQMKVRTNGIGEDLQLNNLVLIDTTNLKITLKGNVSINPTWTHEIEFDADSIKRFYMGSKGTSLVANFEAAIKAQGAFTLVNRIDTLKKLSQRYVTIKFVGVIPIVIVTYLDFIAKTTVDFKAKLNDTIRFTSNNSVDIGIEYLNNRWNPVTTFSSKNDFYVSPLKGDFEAGLHISLEPTFNVKIYNVFGPSVAIGPHILLKERVASPSLDWDIAVGGWLKATVGASGEIFGKNLFDFSKVKDSDTLFYKTPGQVIKTDGDNQFGKPSKPLEKDLKIKVMDNLGFVQPGVQVYYKVVDGGGTIDSAKGTTDNNGFSKNKWTLGTSLTPQHVSVTVKKGDLTIVKDTPVIFTAVAGFALGDTTSGGVIFHLDATKPGDPQHGLVCAFPSAVFRDSLFLDPTIAMARLLNGTMEPANDTSFGAGGKNTDTLITSYGAGAVTAKTAKNFVSMGFGNWYLPSKGELRVIYNNQSYLKSFKQLEYWTSNMSSIASANTNTYFGYTFNMVTGAYSAKNLGNNLNPSSVCCVMSNILPIRKF